MWEDPVPSVEEDAAPFEEPDPAANVAWTDGQLMRLENEFRKAQRAFAYHPVIGITPLRGDPPHEYQINYRVRSLVMDEDGNLQYVDEVSMHVWLPPGFPNQPPVVRPLIGVFHPNISWEGVFLTRTWVSTDTLITLAGQIGELLAFRNYDQESVVNSVAMDWLVENSGAIPLDAHADFSPFNSGEPLGRIQRLGPATLDQIRRALDDMRYALLGERGAPTAEEVVDFAKQTRAAVSLFLDSEVPDSLREQAVEFDDWCRELPGSVPLWEYLRHQRTRAGAAEAAAISLKNAAQQFGEALAEVEAMVRGETITTAAAAVAAIPPMTTLQPLQLKVPTLGREFEKWAAEARGLIEAMKEAPPDVPIAADGSLGRRLAKQSETIRETVAASTTTAEQALAWVDPLFRRLAPELAALEQVAGWREYMDMFAKARSLEKKLSKWGSGGVQAFYLTNTSGTFGPFQLEAPIDLGGARVVVRSTARAQLELIDAVGLDVLGRSTNGTLAVMLGQSEGNPGYQTGFKLSERCDDIVVQLGFVQQQTIDALSRLQRPVSGATSWCGVISVLLAHGHQQQNLRDANRKAAHRWKALMSDLAALSKFKERLATYYLVERMSEEVPRVRGLISKTQAQHHESTQKISTIMGKSSRDVETDRLIVPPKFVTTYKEELHNRDQAKHELARLGALLKQIGRELAARLSSSRLCGRPEVPAFRAMTAIPPELAELQEAMSDEALTMKVSALEEQLEIKLPINAAPAPAHAPMARPSNPAAQAAARAARPSVPEESYAEVQPEPQSEAEFTTDESAESAGEPAIEYSEEPAPEETMIEGLHGDDTASH